MNRLLAFALPVLFILVASGCSVMPTNDQDAKHIHDLNTEALYNYDAVDIKGKLYSQYKQWKGVPYSLGGLSTKGVDCSGFVYVTYRDKFGLTIPRNTKLLSRAGKEISRTELRSGDLVFFKTGFKARHVGIYIEDGKFVHASSDLGVVISSLNDYYWKDKYWRSRRIGL